mgnify:CR=1 FL=1
MEVQYLWLVIAGATVGLVSSYFGVGACFIMVPIMISVLMNIYNVNPSLAPLIAFGSNMAIVVPTAISGVIRHKRELAKKGVSFPLNHYLKFGIFVGIGSFLGSLLAFIFFTTYRAIAGLILKGLFGLMCLVGAYRFMRARAKTINELSEPSTIKYALAGLLCGGLAHFIGIGGGLIYLPTLNVILEIPIHIAVSLSIATMIIGSSIGALSFGILGYIDQLKHPTEYPPYTFGWFNLLLFLLIGLPSIIFAQLGPRLAHRTPPRKLKILLAILYVYIGVRLTLNSVMQLQGLPPIIP